MGSGVCVCVHLCVIESVCVCLCLCVCLRVCPWIYVSVCVCVHWLRLSVCLCVSLCMCVPLCVSMNMSLRVSVCTGVWLSVYVYVSLYMCAFVCVCEYMSLCVSTYTCVFLCVFTCMCVLVCISVSVNVSLCLWACLGMCVSVFVSACVCVCVSMCMCLCMWPVEQLWAGSPFTSSSPSEPDSKKLQETACIKFRKSWHWSCKAHKKDARERQSGNQKAMLLKHKPGLAGAGCPSTPWVSCLHHCWQPALYCQDLKRAGRGIPRCLHAMLKKRILSSKIWAAKKSLVHLVTANWKGFEYQVPFTSRKLWDTGLDLKTVSLDSIAQGSGEGAARSKGLRVTMDRFLPVTDICLSLLLCQTWTAIALTSKGCVRDQWVKRQKDLHSKKDFQKDWYTVSTK